jgi:A/G-specific adenine glycosylase
MNFANSEEVSTDGATAPEVKKVPRAAKPRKPAKAAAPTRRRASAAASAVELNGAAAGQDDAAVELTPIEFRRRLGAWYRTHARELPWRGTTDPYYIWVSEIMLQQTRAAAVIPYYGRFLARFPTVHSLAGSKEDEVLALWSGLGYYSRARNLRAAAIRIATAGGFPREYAGLKELPGIGDYTAAAIASIAFGEPHAVLDGNVLRVVARVENDAADIGSPRTRTRFGAVAQTWLDARHSGAFNQALMELGATVCLPRNPLCLTCPLTKLCRARIEGTASQLPVKLGRKQPVQIEGALLVIQRAGKILLQQRAAEERRMAGFWDLPGPDDVPRARIGTSPGQIRHTITHHIFTIRVHLATLTRVKLADEMRWFAPDELSQIPLSTSARKALKLAGVL